MFRLNVHTLIFWLFCSALLFSSIEQCRIERRLPGVFADIDRRLRRDRAEIDSHRVLLQSAMASLAEVFPNEKNRHLADLSFTYIRHCEAYCNFIDTVKQQLVAAAGGPSYTDPRQPRDPHNRKAASRVLLESTDGNLPLLEQIGRHSRALSSSIAEETMLQDFSRYSPLPIYFFEEIPHPEQLNAAGALAMLSNLQTQTAITITMVLNHLYERGADAGSLRFFDAFMPAAITPSGGFLIAGEKYTADIFLIRYPDRLHTTYFKVNGKALPLKDHVGRFETWPEHPGRNTYTVEAEFTTVHFNRREARFVIDTTRISKIFSFYAGRRPFAQIQPEYGQFLYAGVDNPLFLEAPGIDPGSIRITAGGAQLRASGTGRFSIRPERPGRVNLQIDVPGEPPAVFGFDARPLPDPVPGLGDSLHGGRVSRQALAGQTALRAHFPEDFDFQENIEIAGFHLTRYRRREDPVECNNAGQVFSPEIRQILSSIQTGDRLVFDDILVQFAGEHQPRIIRAMSFLVKD